MGRQDGPLALQLGIRCLVTDGARTVADTTRSPAKVFETAHPLALTLPLVAAPVLCRPHVRHADHLGFLRLKNLPDRLLILGI